MAKLPDKFYTQPESARAMLPTEDFRSILVATDGFIMACGKGYRICSKSAGAGVREVWLEESEPPKKPERAEKPVKKSCDICVRVSAVADAIISQISGPIPEGVEGRDVAFGRLQQSISVLTMVRDWTK